MTTKQIHELNSLGRALESADMMIVDTGTVTAKVTYGALVGGVTSDIQADVAQLQEDVGALQTDVETLQTDVDTAEGNIGTLQTNVGALQTGLSTAQGDISTLQSDLSTAQAAIANTETDVAALQAVVESICPVVTAGPTAVVTINDALPMAPQALTVAVTASQSGEGDPSPTNIRPITGWTGANLHHGTSADDPDAQTYAFTFPASIGTVYGGTLDVLTGILTVTHAAFVVDGSTVAYTYVVTSSGRGQFRVQSAVFKQAVQGAAVAVSNWLPTTLIRINSGTGFLYGYATGTASDTNDFEDMLGITSAEQLNAMCAETPLTVVYPLKTPVTYQLTPVQITMLTGANTLWADCGNTTLTYRANPYDRLLSRIEALEDVSLGLPEIDQGWQRPIAMLNSSGLSYEWVDASDDAPVRPTLLSSTQAQPDTTDEPTEDDDA